MEEKVIPPCDVCAMFMIREGAGNTWSVRYKTCEMVHNKEYKLCDRHLGEVKDLRDSFRHRGFDGVEIISTRYL